MLRKNRENFSYLQEGFYILIKKFLCSERGNIESSLVLIPLLTVFLIATQISVAIHTRNMTKISIQDDAGKHAISGEFLTSDSFLHIYSPDQHQNLDLVISHKRTHVPQILESQREVDVSGIAIVENQR